MGGNMVKWLLIKLFSIVLILSMLGFAQTPININGTVKNASGTAVANAAIVLLKEGKTTQTAADGSFGFRQNVGVLPGAASVLTPNTIHFSGTSVLLSLQMNSNVQIEIFDIRGKRIQNVKTYSLESGSYTLSLANDNLPFQECIAQVKIGDLSKSCKFLNIPGSVTGRFQATNENRSAPLSKKQNFYVDTLQVTASGYTVRKIPIYSYFQNLAITMAATGSDPIIIYKDMFLGYDTATIGTLYKQIPQNRGDTLLLNLSLENIGGSNALSVKCSLSTLDPNVTIRTAVAGFNNIAAQNIVNNLSQYKITVNPAIPPAQNVKFLLHISDSWGGSWLDSCFFLINPFVVEAQVIDDDNIPDSRGNSNGYLDAGEIIEYTPRLQNKTGKVITDVQVLLLSTNSNVTVKSTDKMWRYGNFAVDAKVLPEFDYVFNVGNQITPPTERMNLFVFGKIDSVPYKWVLPISLPYTNHPPVTDIEGNVYTTVTIGTQVWTVENLRVTRYNDSTAIPLVTDNTAWRLLTTPAYCQYNNRTNVDSIKKWGALYNWYVVDPANVKKIAPAGWHVPTNAEWITMENYLIANGFNYDGITTGNKIAKSLAAKTDWAPDSTAGDIGMDLTINNWSGFSALPGGSRYSNGTCTNVGYYGYWWSATALDASTAYNRFLCYDNYNLSGYNNYKSFGFSVRLVRD